MKYYFIKHKFFIHALSNTSQQVNQSSKCWTFFKCQIKGKNIFPSMTMVYVPSIKVVVLRLNSMGSVKKKKYTMHCGAYLNQLNKPIKPPLDSTWQCKQKTRQLSDSWELYGWSGMEWWGWHFKDSCYGRLIKGIDTNTQKQIDTASTIIEKKWCTALSDKALHIKQYKQKVERDWGLLALIEPF